MWGQNYALIRARAGNMRSGELVTKCERPGQYSALRVEPDMLCARGHFLEIGSMVEEGWDWHNELIVLGCINGSYPDISKH